MTKFVHRSGAMLAVIAAGLLIATSGLAQMPASPWKKAAPFPEPDEELYSAVLDGKMYVIGGWGEGKARGVNYEYDPASDAWTKKAPMPRPAHHAALVAFNGKIYACGGFVAPEKSPLPIGGFLWSNSLAFHGDDVLVTNLSLDVGALSSTLRTVDGPWAAQVKLHTVSKIKQRIPSVAK